MKGILRVQLKEIHSIQPLVLWTVPGRLPDSIIKSIWVVQIDIHVPEVLDSFGGSREQCAPALRTIKRNVQGSLTSGVNAGMVGRMLTKTVDNETGKAFGFLFKILTSVNAFHYTINPCARSVKVAGKSHTKIIPCDSLGRIEGDSVRTCIREGIEPLLS